MRRKRLVVVAVATSAVLLAGGIAATAAGAEETPDVPGLPGFSMSGLFGWDDEDPASDDTDDDTGSSGTADQAGADAGPREPADRPQQATDARPKPALADGRPAPAQRPHQADPGFAVQGPAIQAPGVHVPVAQAPVAQRPAADRPMTNLLSASREDVTAADISSSPNAPVQQQVLALINQNRRRYGCDSLSLDRRLIDAANEHAADMARRDYFAHESPNGDGPGDRVSGAGYNWRRYGENIARGVDSAYEVVDGWMHSPEHRHNILDCRLDQMGIGLAIDRDHDVYWVQDFATPMD
jgi:uncharacterized protein YkwD